MKKGLRILTVTGMLLAAAAMAGVLFARDDIIIRVGIIAYRRLFRDLLIIEGAFAGVTVIQSFAEGIVRRKERQAEEVLELQIQARARAKAEAAADLSVSRKLDTSVIRRMLEQEKNDRWLRLCNLIERCLKQMDRMDDYQARLNSLLTKNDASMLKDTEEVLDQVEQYICRNMRKALNYLSILNAEIPDDLDKAQKQLNSCIEDNDRQLAQVQEFLLALADLLNMQGSGTQEIETLEMYKNMILESVRREESDH